MKKTVLLLIALSLALCIGTGCRKGTSIMPVTSATGLQADGKAFSADTVRKAILEACIMRGWIPTEINPALIEASITVRGKHTVVVAITYSQESFSIAYKSSVNMAHKVNQDGTEVIHPNYHKWVNTLEQDIRKAIASKTL